MALRPGDSLRLFRIVEPLGGGRDGFVSLDGRTHGSLGEPTVYKAEDTRLGRPVAIKTLRHGCGEHEDCRRRLLMEVGVLAQFSHPNLPCVHGVEDDVPLVVMELIAGTSLMMVVSESPRVPGRKAAAIVAGVGSALTHLHDAGLVYGNLALQHVMIRKDLLTATLRPEDVCLVDYTAVSSVGRASDKDGADPRSDIWALGAMTFEILTGQHPFAASSLEERLVKMQYEGPPSALAVNPELPSACEGSLSRALAANPAERYHSVEEFVRDISGALVGSPATDDQGDAGARGAPWRRLFGLFTGD